MAWHSTCARTREVIHLPHSAAPPVFRSILCPVDFSANSRAALRYASMLARLADAHLLVLYVEDPLLVAAMATRTSAAVLALAGKDELRSFVTRALRGATPAVATTLMTKAGKPAQEIVKAAGHLGSDLIVIGYRGAGRAARLIFGSTTEGVVHASAVPVLAIPPARRSARLPRARRVGLERAS